MSAVTSPKPAIESESAVLVAPKVEGDVEDAPQSLPKSKLDQEHNPFERSFSGTDTSKSSNLPGMSTLTSPSANNIGMASGWSSFGSLRNGPLSPAMLLGPNVFGGGFDGTLRTGLTPNESSIRTGLTPRGDNAGFPMPSPNTSALLASFGTGLTPGGNQFGLSGPGGSFSSSMFARPLPKEAPSTDTTSIFKSKPDLASHQHHNSAEASDAANGLYMLAQHSQQQSQHHDSRSTEDLMRRATTNSAAKHGASMVHANSLSPTLTSAKRAANGRRKSSFDDEEEMNDGHSIVKKGRPSVNKVRTNTDSGNESDDGMNDGSMGAPKSSSGKKETDEEKRKNFLERNRQAALKCRQRKKQWLQNLQAKVEFYGTENDQLTTQVTSLREEIVNLKTLLLAHKDCPVARSHGVPQADQIHLQQRYQ